MSLGSDGCCHPPLMLKYRSDAPTLSVRSVVIMVVVRLLIIGSLSVLDAIIAVEGDAEGPAKLIEALVVQEVVGVPETQERHDDDGEAGNCEPEESTRDNEALDEPSPHRVEEPLLRTQSLGCFKQQQTRGIDHNGEIINAHQRRQRQEQHVTEEPASSRGNKGEKNEPGPLPKIIIDQLNRKYAIRLQHAILVVPIGRVLSAVLPAVPLVTHEWVVLLILIDADGLAARLEIIHAVVADLGGLEGV